MSMQDSYYFLKVFILFNRLLYCLLYGRWYMPNFVLYLFSRTPIAAMRIVYSWCFLTQSTSPFFLSFFFSQEMEWKWQYYFLFGGRGIRIYDIMNSKENTRIFVPKSRVKISRYLSACMYHIGDWGGSDFEHSLVLINLYDSWSKILIKFYMSFFLTW